MQVNSDIIQKIIQSMELVYTFFNNISKKN